MNNSYWEERLLRFNNEVLKDMEKRSEELINAYKKAFNENLTNEISEIYNEYADNNGEISYTKILKYNRLKKINEKFKNIALELGANEIEFLKDNFPEIIKKSYEEVGIMLEVSFETISKDIIDYVVNYPWSGKDYKSTVWDNKELLIKNLKQIVTKGIINGDSINKMLAALKKVMEQEAWKCRRIIRTETMHMINAGHYERYKKAGIKQLKYVATHDYYSDGKPRYCESCMGNDGKIYEIDNAPMLPLHPNCRCTLIPIVDIKD